MPTATLEEYLELIYKLSERGEVRPTPLADALGVAGPTVTATLKRLESRGYVQRSNGAIILTREGKALAVDIVRRHRVAEKFLVDVLGIPWAEAHEDACSLEHALSPRVVDALERFLDDPTHCPHGHPIPTPEGAFRTVDGRPLSALSPGESARILQAPEDDRDVLSYLGSLSMFPGTVVTLREIAPSNGPLLVEVEGKRYAIGRDVADAIVVER